MTCNEAQNYISLELYGELASPERELLAAHLAACEPCAAEAASARSLHSLLLNRAATEIAPDLLVQCRQALEARLDRERHGWRNLWTNWKAFAANPSRVASALVLLVFGFGLGWLIRPHAARVDRSGQPGSAQPQLASFAPSDIGAIRNISQVTRDPQSDSVRITLSAERRVTLEGSLQNPSIRGILVDAMRSYSNPGIRLDAANALSQNSANPHVQDVLLYAMRHDPNTGVRLEALRSVPEMNWDAQVQSALVEAIQQDQNPGVRVAAVDTLVQHAVSRRDRQMIPVLQTLARSDANRYVRVKALTAVRDLEIGN